MEGYNKISDQLISIGLADWVNIEDIMNIFDAVFNLEPGQIYLEIGVAYGASLSVACIAAMDGVNIYGIDVIDQSGRADNIQKMLDLYDRKFTHFFINSDSQMEAKGWNRGPIDVLYIDGDHSPEGVMRDLISWLPRVKNGGKIIFDDYNDKTGVKQVVDRLILNNQMYKNQTVNGESFTCIKAW
jgi:predicted O-methyltransferase YrrM